MLAVANTAKETVIEVCDKCGEAKELVNGKLCRECFDQEERKNYRAEHGLPENDPCSYDLWCAIIAYAKKPDIALVTDEAIMEAIDEGGYSSYLNVKDGADRDKYLKVLNLEHLKSEFDA